MRNLTNYFCVLSPFNLAGFRLTRNNSLLNYFNMLSRNALRGYISMLQNLCECKGTTNF